MAAAAADEQLLLLTHCGPRGSGTTIYWRDMARAPIQSGSSALVDHVRRQAPALLAVVHGHTHAGAGRCATVCPCQSVLRPGTLGQIFGAIVTCVLWSHEHKKRNGAGRGHVGFTPVFNPGPLKDGEYAILTLRRSEESAAGARDRIPGGAAQVARSVERRWRVESFEQRRLRGMLAQATLAE